MNADVYFAEPDQDDLVGTPEGERANEAYCDIVRYGNVKYAMVNQLQRPSVGFEDAIRTHFRLRKAGILAMVEGWLETARKGCIGGPRTTRRRATGKQDVGYLHINKPVVGSELDVDKDHECDDDDDDDDDEMGDGEEDDELEEEEEEEDEDDDDDDVYDGHDDDEEEEDDDASIDAEAHDVEFEPCDDDPKDGIELHDANLVSACEHEIDVAMSLCSSGANKSGCTAALAEKSHLSVGMMTSVGSMEVAAQSSSSDHHYHCVPGAGVVKISADVVHYSCNVEAKPCVSEVHSTLASAASVFMGLDDDHAQHHGGVVLEHVVKANVRPVQKREPMPNYRAEFVQSHNPDLAERCVYVRCVYVHVCMNVCMSVCVCACIYVCMYVWGEGA